MSRTLLIGICAAAFTVACTSGPQTRTEANRTGTNVTSQASDLTCLRDTGTRIPLREHECAMTPGRVYSQEDFYRTGATNVGDALRLLDPSITVGH